MVGWYCGAQVLHFRPERQYAQSVIIHYICSMFASISRFLLILLICSSTAVKAQEVWTLERCVQYAIGNNISIQQQELNERLSALQLQQSRYSQLPNINGNAAGGRSLGRSVDPTTNQFVSASYNFLNLSGNADVLLFGWFQKRHQINQNKFSLEAARADLDQLENDVSLNVATGYLRALLAREQIRISENQVNLSREQLRQTKLFETAGRVPELDVAQLESQLATDSANLITAIADYNASILDLKALLNLDFNTPFEVVSPDAEVAGMMPSVPFDPEAIYNVASQRFGSVQGGMMRLAAARQASAAMKGSQWPQLGLSFQSGSTYASTFNEVTGFTVDGVQQSGSYISVNDVMYPVYQPVLIPTTTPIAFGKQLDNNFRQTISLGLSIPIMNGWQTRYNIRRAQLDIQNQELSLQQTELNLKQDIYKACNDAVNSIHKYNAAMRAAVAARRAFEFAQKRYDMGLTNMVEYLTIQNNQYRADANLASARYDLIFRLKVIDYYLGKDIKL